MRKHVVRLLRLFSEPGADGNADEIADTGADERADGDAYWVANGWSDAIAECASDGNAHANASNSLVRAVADAVARTVNRPLPIGALVCCDAVHIVRWNMLFIDREVRIGRRNILCERLWPERVRLLRVVPVRATVPGAVDAAVANPYAGPHGTTIRHADDAAVANPYFGPDGGTECDPDIAAQSDTHRISIGRAHNAAVALAIRATHVHADTRSVGRAMPERPHIQH